MSQENRRESATILGSVKQTITADHHPDPKQSAIEQARWPRIWAATTTPMQECHAKETRPAGDEPNRQHDSRDR